LARMSPVSNATRVCNAPLGFEKVGLGVPMERTPTTM